MVSKTDDVQKSKVQAESFAVGAKVMYKGREMIVSRAPEYEAELMKMIDLSAIFALCDALPQMTALIELKCACPPPSTRLCPNMEAGPLYRVLAFMANVP
jgi:predicted TIM-barrel fold metal-dependent hydrolase